MFFCTYVVFILRWTLESVFWKNNSQLEKFVQAHSRRKKEPNRNNKLIEFREGTDVAQCR